MKTFRAVGFGNNTFCKLTSLGLFEEITRLGGILLNSDWTDVLVIKSLMPKLDIHRVRQML